jgi:hypothetical protein
MTRTQAALVVLACCFAVQVGVLQADFRASDPGVRLDSPNGTPTRTISKSAANSKFQASEANAVVDNFSQPQEQDLLKFLRSLSQADAPS